LSLFSRREVVPAPQKEKGFPEIADIGITM